MTPRRWSGRMVTSAREYWRQRLVAAGALPCWRCGKALTVHSRWTVGHLVDRASGGSLTSVSNQWVECASCNYRAGGRAGAAKTNKRANPTATRPALASEAARGIRGW